MKIVTLVENCVQKRGLLAEHGLSFYIETSGIESSRQKILFDTGQSDILIHNAKQLGINIADIDTIIISHGHYDHTGGLSSLLKINKKAQVIVKRNALTPKYRRLLYPKGQVPETSSLTGRVTEITSPVELATNLFIMPDITVSNPADTSYDGDDRFEDELFLAFKGGTHISVISSCSHNGITNIAGTASHFFSLPLDLIIGGFHTRAASTERIRSIINALKTLSPRSIGVCHCTGIDNYLLIRKELTDINVFYNQTGNSVTINS
ncbi:MAG: MBL fold metallo-hydrolase [Bacteroidales bacterium]|nr:MBL fold metallo-hydrolase [Bacteroidales bacterium]MDD2425518.1 MBL fold metallo-hydrolase [Bacteroidales bacterium]MDD3989408.1 MBL fold metallo-hydrolase [Bacteroidales bacterium]MDD4639365.1 MBL fold metallo-hydrolase [Bacteroidales bacterium]